VSEAEGKTFLAMELVEGEGLDHILKRVGDWLPETH
jgi:hypothetical protein